MRAKFINKTHRTLTLAEGVELPANSVEIIEVADNSRIRQLSKMGLIVILPEGSKRFDRNALNSAPASETTKMRRNDIATAIRAAKAKRDAEANKTKVQASTTTVKATANKSSNAKGK